jgi:uncharacterized protein DUF5667
MTWGKSAQRRAEQFNTLVERQRVGPDPGGADPRDAELLELVGALRAVPDAEPRAAFTADLRSRLMVEAATTLVPDDVARLRLPARHTRRERRLAALVGGLVAVGATASVAVASQSALPGESLYPIKRALEGAQSGLAFGEQSRGDRQLAAAANRLDEVAALTADEGVGTDAQIERTLSAFTSQATSGADLLLSDYAHHDSEESIADLRDFASTSLGQLEELEPAIPYAARDELVEAARTVAQIDAEAAQQCPECGGTPITNVPPTLLAAETITVPDVPIAAAPEPVATPGPSGRPGRGSGTSDGPDLPDVEGSAVPPGSVADPESLPLPTTSPSQLTDPVRALTEGLTSALTGQGGQTPAGGAQTGATTGPVTGLVQGVTDILEGVLQPITQPVLPSPQVPTLP